VLFQGHIGVCLQLGDQTRLQRGIFLGGSPRNRLGQHISRLSSLLEVAFERRQGDVKHVHNLSAGFPLINRSQDFCSQILGIGFHAFILSPGSFLPPAAVGLLNSKALDFYLKNVSTQLRGGFFRYFTQFIEQLPIRTINFSDSTEKARHDRMVELVERMLSLYKRLAEARAPHDKTIIQQQINQADQQVDRLVYELYGLTEEEIKMVEGKLQD
jgi:hypothetical protein